MKRKFGLVGGILLGAIVVTIAIAYLWPKSVAFSDAVLKASDFAVFVPNSKAIIIDPDTVKYNSQDKVVAFTVTIGQTAAVVSEQATPEQFTDIPQVYDKVLSSMRQYQSFEVPLGKVYLTRPAEQQGKQAAVMNTKGTLMFVKPTTDLTEDQWRDLFLNLKIRK